MQLTDWVLPTASAQMTCSSYTQECEDPNTIDSDNDGTPDISDPCPDDPNDRCNDKNPVKETWNLFRSIWNFLVSIISSTTAAFDGLSEWLIETGGGIICVFDKTSTLCEDEGDRDETEEEDEKKG